VYLQSTTDAEKRDVSKKTIDFFDCVCSTQVLNELSNVLLKKAKMSFDHVAEIIDGTIQACELVVVTYETILCAIEIAKRNMFGFYDSLIVASALETECEYLLTEDLADGQKIGKRLTIVNIFDHPEFFNDI
jgi:predicted nucleic acid-binding protein